MKNILKYRYTHFVYFNIDANKAAVKKLNRGVLNSNESEFLD